MGTVYLPYKHLYIVFRRDVHTGCKEMMNLFKYKNAATYFRMHVADHKMLKKYNLSIHEAYPIEIWKIWELEHWLGFPKGGTFGQLKSMKTGKLYDKDYFPDKWKEPLK